jgi:hypothetical protein
LLEGAGDTQSLAARIGGRAYRLDLLGDGDGFRYDDGMVSVHVSQNGKFSGQSVAAPLQANHLLDVGRFHSLATLLRGITDTTRVHAVNTPILAVNPANPRL